jgi:hypothetical protein
VVDKTLMTQKVAVIAGTLVSVGMITRTVIGIMQVIVVKSIMMFVRSGG